MADGPVVGIRSAGLCLLRTTPAGEKHNARCGQYKNRAQNDSDQGRAIGSL